MISQITGKVSLIAFENNYEVGKRTTERQGVIVAYVSLFNLRNLR